MRGAPPRRSHRAPGSRRSASSAVGLMAALLLGVAACGGSTGTSLPAAASPSAALPSGSDQPVPKPTIWPTTTVEAAIALGAADGDFSKVASDVVKAVDSQNPATILQVIKDTLTFLSGNQKNIVHLQDYPATKAVGDQLAVAYAQMIEGATKVRDGLVAGNADAIQQGFVEFFNANTAYVKISPALGDLADQAIFMKRQLLR